MPTYHCFELCEQALWLHYIGFIVPDSTFALSIVSKVVSVDPFRSLISYNLVLKILIQQLSQLLMNSKSLNNVLRPICIHRQPVNLREHVF